MGIFEQQQTLSHIAEELLNADVPMSGVIEHVLGKDLILHSREPYFKNKTVWGDLADAPYRAALKFTSEVYKPIESKRLAENSLYEKYPSMRTGFFFEAPKVSKGGQVILDNFGNPVLTKIPDFDGLAKFLRDEMHLRTTTSFSYIYEEDRYRLIDDGEIKQIIDQITKAKALPHHVRDFASAVFYKNYCRQEEFQCPDGSINVKNGVLNIKTKELSPHTPSKFFNYILPHEFNKDAKCDRWLEFLNFIFEGNQELIDVTAEIFGYMLAGGDPWLHKAFFLEGSGRNGKSTWLDVLKALLGSANYCSIPLKNLDKPFSVVMADGKLANIVGELDSKDLSSEAFKTAVGGEELIAAHKGKPEYQLKFRAKIVVATNNPVNFRDSSPGNYEKLYILPFNRYITEDERNPNIRDELIADLPGVLAWSLEGYQRLLNRSRLPKINVIIEALDEHRINSDAVFQWFEEYVSLDDSIENAYQLGAFYEHFQTWCKSEGRYAVTKNWFVRGVVRELKRKIPNLRISKSKAKTRCTGRYAILAKPNYLSMLP